MGCSTEGANTLDHLRRISVLVEIYCKEDIVVWQIERRRLYRSEEVGDVLHLYKRHPGVFELDGRAGRDGIDKPVVLSPVSFTGERKRSGPDERSDPYLQRTIPSFRLSSTSLDGSFSFRDSSIHSLISLAACGVYFDSRRFLRSLSRDVTDAILMKLPRKTGTGYCHRWE